MKTIILTLLMISTSVFAQGLSIDCNKVQNWDTDESIKRHIANIQDIADASPDMFLDDKTAKALGMTDASEDNPPSYKVSMSPDEAKSLSSVVIYVDKSPRGKTKTAQTMMVYVDGELVHEFDVSTGSEQVKTSTSGRTYFTKTPTGVYRPDKMYEHYESATWTGATMHNSIFFAPGIAIHATTPDHYNEIGQRDSGGCIRLMPEDAKTLFDTVLAHGVGDAVRAENKDDSHHTSFGDGRWIERHRVMFENSGQTPSASVEGVDYNGNQTGRMTRDFDTTIVVANFADDEYDGAQCMVSDSRKCKLDRSAYGK